MAVSIADLTPVKNLISPSLPHHIVAWPQFRQIGQPQPPIIRILFFSGPDDDNQYRLIFKYVQCAFL